jgi:hypothetical protein
VFEIRFFSCVTHQVNSNLWPDHVSNFHCRVPQFLGLLIVEQEVFEMWFFYYVIHQANSNIQQIIFFIARSHTFWGFLIAQAGTAWNFSLLCFTIYTFARIGSQGDPTFHCSVPQLFRSFNCLVSSSIWNLIFLFATH